MLIGSLYVFIEITNFTSLGRCVFDKHRTRGGGSTEKYQCLLKKRKLIYEIITECNLLDIEVSCFEPPLPPLSLQSQAFFLTHAYSSDSAYLIVLLIVCYFYLNFYKVIF